MSWFIRKGEPVQESKPTNIHFDQDFLVSLGKPKSVHLQIFCDERSDEAPVHFNRNVRKLVSLEADISHLTRTDLNKTIVTGKDGKRYYSIDCDIEATFYSASTKYILLCQDKKYDTVTAEYA